jgi:UDPglucose 6-dehydrogenase
MAEHLIEDGAQIHVYDPKCLKQKIKADMQYLWELNGLSDKKITAKLKQIHVYKTPMEAIKRMQWWYYRMG